MNNLTIVIPTRNRLSNLVRQINSLEELVDERIKIIIIDNNSNAEELILLESFIKIKKLNIEFVRNRFNIGGDANILRSFEYCNTEWIFPLGDSKLLSINSIGNILDAIQKYAESSFINFHYPSALHGERSKDIIVFNSDELVDKLDSYGNILLLGNTVYRVSAIKDAFYKAYSMICTHAAHFSLMYVSLLNKDTYAVISHKQIIGEMLEKKETFESASILDCRANFPVLENLALSQKSAIKILNLVSGVDSRPFQPFLWVIYNTLKMHWDSDDSRAKSIYKKIVYLNYRETSILRLIVFYFLVDVFVKLPYSKVIFQQLAKYFKKFKKNIKLI